MRQEERGSTSRKFYQYIYSNVFDFCPFKNKFNWNTILVWTQFLSKASKGPSQHIKKPRQDGRTIPDKEEQKKVCPYSFICSPGKSLFVLIKPCPNGLIILTGQLCTPAWVGIIGTSYYPPGVPPFFACHTPEAASPQLTDRRKKENTAEYTHLKRRRLLYTDYLALVIYFAGRFYRHFSTTAFLGITVHFFGCRDIFVDFPPPPTKNELRAPRRGYRNWVIVCSLEMRWCSLRAHSITSIF